MDKKLSLGIIGLGYWGPNLIRNLDSLRDYCSLNFLCDTNKDVLKKILMRDNQKFSTDYKEVCDDPNIDAVVISTPTSTHYEIVKYALTKEKDVFCEKPLTNNLEHAEEIVELADKHQRITMVGNVFVYHSAVRELKKRIDSGELGQIYEINTIRKGHGPIRSDVNVMWDLAPHDISIVLYLAGRMPEKVNAIGFNYLKNRSLEDSVDLILAFDENIGARINLSWLYPLKERRVTVVGSKKMAVFDDVSGIRPVTLYERSVIPFGEQPSPDFGEFKMQTTDGEITMPKIDTVEPMKLELQHFLECITKRQTPLTDAKNGRDIVKILEKAQEALNKPYWIEI